MAKRVVVLGGGTGTSVVLRSLKSYDVELTAIVATADDGSSTGILREAYATVPVGDLRQCFLALSEASAQLRASFAHRFPDGPMAGHVVGNIVLTGLLASRSSVSDALREAKELFQIRGNVIPVTTSPSVLSVVSQQTGERIVGEHLIDEADLPGVWDTVVEYDPAGVSHEAIDSILTAEAIVLGPGSFYGSTLAVLIPEVCRAIQSTSAALVYVGNLTTSERCNARWSVKDFVGQLEKHVGRRVDLIISNSGAVPEDAGISVRLGSWNEDDRARIVEQDLVCKEIVALVPGDVIRRTRVKHDEVRLGKTLWRALFAPKAFIDFDDTLMHRSKMTDDIFAAFGERSVDELRDLYREFRLTAPFTVNGFVQFLIEQEVNGERLRDLFLDHASRTNEYVFDDAKLFLAELDRRGYEPILLTVDADLEGWQWSKLRASGLLPYFSRVVPTTGKKTDRVRAIVKGHDWVFFDDKESEVEEMMRECPKGKCVLRKTEQSLAEHLESFYSA